MLTAAIEGFDRSPAGGCVTSAPRKISGSWNTRGLKHATIMAAADAATTTTTANTTTTTASATAT